MWKAYACYYLKHVAKEEGFISCFPIHYSYPREDCAWWAFCVDQSWPSTWVWGYQGRALLHLILTIFVLFSSGLMLYMSAPITFKHLHGSFPKSNTLSKGANHGSPKPKEGLLCQFLEILAILTDREKCASWCTCGLLSPSYFIICFPCEVLLTEIASFFSGWGWNGEDHLGKIYLQWDLQRVRMLELHAECQVKS